MGSLRFLSDFELLSQTGTVWERQSQEYLSRQACSTHTQWEPDSHLWYFWWSLGLLFFTFLIIWTRCWIGFLIVSYSIFDCVFCVDSHWFGTYAIVTVWRSLSYFTTITLQALRKTWRRVRIAYQPHTLAMLASSAAEMSCKCQVVHWVCDLFLPWVGQLIISLWHHLKLYIERDRNESSHSVPVPLTLLMTKWVPPVNAGDNQTYKAQDGLNSVGHCVLDMQFEMTFRVVHQFFHSLLMLLVLVTWLTQIPQIGWLK